MSFPILHISDAHLGLRDLDEAFVLAPLFDCLTKDVKKIGQPRLVVFSGDLIWGHQSGKPKPIAQQFENAAKFFDEVYKAIGCTQTDAPLAIVPGNHDLDRDQIDVTHLDYKLTRSKVEALITNESSFARFTARQKDFAHFVKSYCAPSNWSWDDKWLSFQGTLLDDQSKIAVVGLNTSWTSSKSDERGDLWIGTPQVQKALMYGQDADFRILVSHHPTWWLDEDEQNNVQALLETYFQLHLHGHEHFGWFTDPTGHVRVAAGAVYQGSRMACGFDWIELALNQEHRELKLHLREYKSEVREWVPRDLGKKAPQGTAIMNSPWRERPDSSLTTNLPASVSGVQTISPEPIFFTQLPTGVELCSVLENYFLAEIGNPQIPNGDRIEYLYWPVRQRAPTIVHAAQAFIAGAFARKGAKVSLWLDNVGKKQVDGQREMLVRKLELWYRKTSGGETFETNYFEDLLLDPKAQATCKTFGRWLGDSEGRSLQKVLEISKVIRSFPPDLGEILNEKPVRLLNPPLVWTGLAHVLSDDRVGFATLGGVDERELWKAWHSVYPQHIHSITHIFCAKLLDYHDRPYDMDRLTWFAKGDLQAELEQEFSKSTSGADFIRPGGIAHWCYTHLVKLPNYLTGSRVDFQISGRNVDRWELIDGREAESIPEALAAAIAKWIS